MLILYSIFLSHQPECVVGMRRQLDFRLRLAQLYRGRPLPHIGGKRVVVLDVVVVDTSQVRVARCPGDAGTATDAGLDLDVCWRVRRG